MRSKQLRALDTLDRHVLAEAARRSSRRRRRGLLEVGDEGLERH